MSDMDTEKMREQLKKIADGLGTYESGAFRMSNRDMLAVFQTALLIDIREALLPKPRGRRPMPPAAPSTKGE